MNKISSLTRAMQDLLTDTANSLARRTGLIRRQRKFTGALFAQTLVFGWLSDRTASLEDLAQTAATLGLGITAQAIDERFSERAALFLEALLGEAAGIIIEGASVQTELIGRFNGVFLIDTSVVGLPAELSERWPGNGGNTATAGKAALKLEVILDLARGGLLGPHLLSGRTHDAAGSLAQHRLPAGALRVADLGYFSQERFAEMHGQGSYWLSRLRTQTALFDRDGRRLDLIDLLERARHCGQGRFERPILLGAREHIEARLLAERVPETVAAVRRRKLRRSAKKRGQTPSERSLKLCAWTLLVTNAAEVLLGFEEAKALYRARWQIELLFRRWKSSAGVGHSRSGKPWRVLCETYAKLLAVVVGQWVLARGLWHIEQKSLEKAFKTLRRHSLHIAAAMKAPRRLNGALQVVLECLGRAGCRVSRRRKHPNTYQLLKNPSLLYA